VPQRFASAAIFSWKIVQIIKFSQVSFKNTLIGPLGLREYAHYDNINRILVVVHVLQTHFYKLGHLVFFFF